MYKLINNVMILNKIIIFLDNLLHEDFDYEILKEKINFEITYINSMCEVLWNDYIKALNRDEDFVKSYTYTIKRFLKLINEISNNNSLINKCEIQKKMLGNCIFNINKKLELISKQDFRSQLVNTKEQCINEEEYELLLNESMNENN